MRLPASEPVQVDALAWLPLSEEEAAKLEVWLADMKRRTAEVDYLALPAHETKLDPVSGRIVQWRFSCAGFVVFAYEEVTGIALVDQAALPASDKTTILEIWRPLASRERYLSMLGLGGDPPWPVLLPGHVLRALGRIGPDDDRSCLPYQPVAADAWFPG